MTISENTDDNSSASHTEYPPTQPSYLKPTTFRMTGSNLTDVPKDIPLNSTTVDLANNSIQVLTSTSFIRLTEVKVMNLNHNKISSIGPGAFHDQTLMTHLDLGNNALQTLSGDMWKGLDSLQVLRITENKITIMAMYVTS